MPNGVNILKTINNVLNDDEPLYLSQHDIYLRTLDGCLGLVRTACLYVTASLLKNSA